MTAAEREELEAEAQVLIAKIKLLLKHRRPRVNFFDIGNMGVPHSEFLAGWNGALLTAILSATPDWNSLT